MSVGKKIETLPLSSLCDFQNGFGFKNTDYQPDPEDAYIVFRMGNIARGGGLNREASGVFFSKGKAKKLKRFLLNEGDLAMCMTDMKASMALLGHTALIDKSDVYILNQRVGRITVRDRERLDHKYLFYYTNSPDYISHLRSVANSGVQVNLSTEEIKKSPIALPSISRQREIGQILSAYDDLIENNSRRIKILEETAQAIYREWFVHFRFLGHKAAKFVESALGRFPQGWELKKVTEAVFVNPRTSVPKDTEKPHVPMDRLATNSMLIGKVGVRKGNNGSKFKNGDTLFARITPCLENGKTAFVQFLPSDADVAIGSTEFIVLRSKTLCPEYVYLMARSNEFRDNAIKSMSGATGRQRVQEECFDKFLIAQPDEQTLVRFQKITRPIFQLVHNLALRNENLRRTRDLLLPKLVSGEIAV